MTWSSSMRWRIVKVAAVCALVAVLVPGLDVLFSRGAQASGSCGNSSCGYVLGCPVIFEAMLGSGETWNGYTNLNVSPELNTVYENITLPPYFLNSNLTTKPEVHVPNYPALPVHTLWSGLPVLPFRIAGNIDKYLGSEKIGVTALSAAISESLHACSTTKFILAGYSQGAMVVHDFLDQLAATSDSPLQRARQASIIGAVLIADPDRVEHSAVQELSTAPNSSYGVCDVARTVFRVQCPATTPLQDVAPMFLSRTVSVCRAFDAACDTSDTLGSADLITSVRYGIKVHQSYGGLLATAFAGTKMSQLLATAF